MWGRGHGAPATRGSLAIVRGLDGENQAPDSAAKCHLAVRCALEVSGSPPGSRGRLCAAPQRLMTRCGAGHAEGLRAGVGGGAERQLGAGRGACCELGVTKPFARLLGNEALSPSLLS